MRILVLWSKLLKKMQFAIIQNSNLEKPSKVNAQSTVINSSIGRYSYCGYDCTLINCRVGRYCSISDHFRAGMASHPLDWVSSSPTFYKSTGRSIPMDELAVLEFAPPEKITTIGNDVWIGTDVLLKTGITVGNGAVIGMGSVVTHDVPPYAIVAGNPARVIRTRFSPEIIQRMEDSQWWERDPSVLKKIANLMQEPKKFLDALEAIE